MKVANFTIPTDDEEVFQEFDKWVSEHPDLFPTKSRNGGRRSAAIVGLMRFVGNKSGCSETHLSNSWKTSSSSVGIVKFATFIFLPPCLFFCV